LETIPSPHPHPPHPQKAATVECLNIGYTKKFRTYIFRCPTNRLQEYQIVEIKVLQNIHVIVLQIYHVRDGSVVKQSVGILEIEGSNPRKFSFLNF
jgi:hypothetical protein